MRNAIICPNCSRKYFDRPELYLGRVLMPCPCGWDWVAGVWTHNKFGRGQTADFVIMDDLIIERGGDEKWVN